MKSTTGQVRSYREQELTAKSPEELLLFLLDTGVRAARRRERKLLIGVLTELMGGIDFSRGEISTGLVSLYDFAVREVRENRYDFAEKILGELGAAFRQAAALRNGGSAGSVAA